MEEYIQDWIDFCSLRAGKIPFKVLDERELLELNRIISLSCLTQTHSSGDLIRLDLRICGLHKDYLGNFKKWWEESEVQGWEGFKFMKKLEQVKLEIKKWNKEVFGVIRVRKVEYWKE